MARQGQNTFALAVWQGRYNDGTDNGCVRVAASKKARSVACNGARTEAMRDWFVGKSTDKPRKLEALPVARNYGVTPYKSGTISCVAQLAHIALFGWSHPFGFIIMRVICLVLLLAGVQGALAFYGDGDVVVLTPDNFKSTLMKQPALVEFFAPW
jgi:hypothetical protein